MKAQQTRRGGRWELQERGGLIEEPIEQREEEQDEPITPATAPLVDFLSARSLLALATAWGWTYS
jgi:hypothetical protein